MPAASVAPVSEGAARIRRGDDAVARKNYDQAWKYYDRVQSDDPLYVEATRKKTDARIKQIQIDSQ